MSHVACDLCNSNDYSVVFGAGVAQVNQVVKCNHCGLMYANPRGQEDCVLIKDYDPEYVLDNVLAQNKWRLEKESLQVRDYRDTRSYVGEKYPDRGTLIEIGSGLGYLLDFFRQDGWSVKGIEPNAGLCKYAEKVLGLTVVPAILEEAGIESNSAEVVSMIHVIEHVPSPISVFKEVFRILKPGGCFVVETPRYDTLMFKLLGKRERSLSCDGHIYFFTTDTLSKMAETAGFKVATINYVGRSLTLDRLLYNIGVISKSKTFQDWLSSMSKKLRLNKVSITLNMRDMQRLYLEKPCTS